MKYYTSISLNGKNFVTTDKIYTRKKLQNE